MKLIDIYSLHREYLEMNGCPTMHCDVMYAVLDVFMWKNVVYIAKSVVLLWSIDTPHMYSYGIDMPNS